MFNGTIFILNYTWLDIMFNYTLQRTLVLITVDHPGKPHTDALFLASVSRIYFSWDLNVGAQTFKHGCKASIDKKINYFHEKDLNNSYFVLFLLNKILYFHSKVKKFQNDIYFICDCVNSANRDDMSFPHLKWYCFYSIQLWPSEEVNIQNCQPH